MPTRFAPNRVAAAQRLERARQVVRENTRYGLPVTKPHLDAIQKAERDYDQATATLTRSVRGG